MSEVTTPQVRIQTYNEGMLEMDEGNKSRGIGGRDRKKQRREYQKEKLTFHSIYKP
jgi:hypothetical protein